MDSDADSTLIRLIRPSGVIVDTTNRDPSSQLSLPSKHIQRRETTVRVKYGQKTARAALKIGRAFEELREPEDTGEENIRREDTGLATGLVVDGLGLPPNSAGGFPAASNGSSGTAAAALASIGTATTASPVTARVANKRKPASGLQDTPPGKRNRTRRGAATDSRLEGSAREDDAQTRQKHVQTRLHMAARPEEPASDSDSEGSNGARFKTIHRLKATKNSSPTPQGQPHIDLAASLHKKCKVQEIKDFLSNVIDTYGEKRLLLYPAPVSFSSRDEKKHLEHLKQFQQCHTFKLWLRKPLQGASGRVGLFLTWTGGWVCQTKVDFKKTTRHIWAAVFTKGKLVIFDSNGDFLPEDVSGKDLWLNRQRVLVTYLKNEGYSFDVWVGGKGNTDEDICLKVTGRWIQKVMAGEIDINNDKVLLDEGFKPVGNMWRVTCRTMQRP